MKDLLLFSGEATPYSVSADAVVTKEKMILTFRVVAQTTEAFSSIIFSEPNQHPTRKNELWKETCFECFIPSSTSTYQEWNFSPSGDWNAYSFNNYRQGVQTLFLEEKNFPKMMRWKTSNEFITQWELPLNAIAFSPKKIGLTMVMKTKTNFLFWALAHNKEQADFHDASSFTHSLSPT